MTLPTSWQTVRVFGTYKRFDTGEAAHGAVTFEPMLVTAPEGAGRTVVLPKPRTVTLDVAGKIDIQLPATDDPDIAPTGWAYRVTEKIGRSEARAYFIHVPLAGGDIDLATATQVVPIDPMATYLTSADIGVNVASQEALDGKATAAQGAKADSAIQPDNAALTNAREWTAATVTQAEAEAGTDTERKAWSVLRVWQAIAAWWAASAAKTKLDGIAAGATVGADWSTNVTNKPTLGNSAALDVGTTAGTVAAGNDARLSDARTPTTHTHTAAQISDSTAVGRGVLTATDAAAARSAIGALATTGGAITGAVTATAASDPAFIAKNAQDGTNKSFGLGVGGVGNYEGFGKLLWGDGSTAMRFGAVPYYAAVVTGLLSATGGLAVEVFGQGTVSALTWESSDSRSGTTLVGYYAYDNFPGTNHTKIWFGGTMTASKLSFAIGNFTQREVASLNEAGHFLTTGPITAQKAVVASLPTGSEGMTAYATNGRKQGEGSGAGTGVPVYFSATKWRRYSDDTEVVA